MRGSVWLASFEGYCGFCGWNPAAALTAFLNGKAMEWWYSLQAATPPTQPLAWATVKAEFLSYFDPQRRTLQSEARAQLMTHQCTMVQFPSVKQYEQEFRKLCREVGGMSASEQIAWFIHGCTPEMKRQCATQPDGTEWRNFDALVQFAIGVETRNEVADAHSTPAPAKRPRLAAASVPSSVPAKQGKGGRSSSTKPKGRPSRPQGTQKKATRGTDIPGRLKGLWAATQKNGWSDEGNRPYTEQRWLEVVRDGRCVICHKRRGVGPDCCAGHNKPSGSGGGAAV
jgi:hypothetical protein